MGVLLVPKSRIQAVEETTRRSVLELPFEDALPTSSALTERRD